MLTAILFGWSDVNKQLVECVPNFSEGRRTDVVDAIVDSIRKVPGVFVLDRSSDFDHNRSVVTFVGTPQAVAEAAFVSIREAASLINLDLHQGVHPRIGATDVVPFVPIEGVTLDDCVALAREVGQRVGNELKIPVYLYEAAATRLERKQLENIRRGGYEVLKTEIQTEVNRLPDFGPSFLGTAGATVIGAREFLIAFNVYLTSGDVSIARQIAKTIRHSSGGFRYLKALGLLVDRQAQVSMNFTDFKQTNLAVVTETIRREAARYGVGISRTELIGLIPQRALMEAAAWYLQLHSFADDQVLEMRMNSVLGASDYSDFD